MKKWQPLIFLQIFSALLLPVAPASPGKLPPLGVAVTIFPLADLVRQVGGDAVEVVTLLPAGASPHTYEPTPAQVAVFARAQLLFMVGGGLDNWAERLVISHRQPLAVAAITQGISLHEGDPHVWLNPVMVKEKVLPTMVDTLSRVMPHRRDDFRVRGEKVAHALEQLDQEIFRTVRGFRRKKYIAFHAAWRYFAQRYGLEEIAVVEPFPGKEPSAQRIRHIVEAGKTAGVDAVLVEAQFNPRIAQAVAEELNGRVVMVDPLGGENAPGRDSYLSLMRYNLGAFAQALQ